MKGVTRLTPIICGEMQPVVWLDGSIKTGFIGGGPAEGRGFPQWALKIFGGDKAHWFTDEYADTRRSLCGRVYARELGLFLPGNYPRCKACERALENKRKYGVKSE